MMGAAAIFVVLDMTFLARQSAPHMAVTVIRKLFYSES